MKYLHKEHIMSEDGLVARSGLSLARRNRGTIADNPFLFLFLEGTRFLRLLQSVSFKYNNSVRTVINQCIG